MKSLSSETVLDVCSSYMHETEMYPRLTSEETRELAIRKDSDKEARDRLITSNLRLVPYVVNSINRRGMDYMDLIMAGNEGLIQGINKYDPVKFNTELSTCVIPWIRQAVDRAVANNCRTIRIPIETSREVDRVIIFRNRYFQEHEEYPDDKCCADALGLSVAKVKKLLSWSTPTGSLDAEIGSDDDGGKTVGDFVSSSDENTSSNETPGVDSIDLLLHRIALTEAMKILSDREKKVIIYRYGLGGGKQMTLKEAAQKLSVSREAVRQIEMRALRKMKGELEEERAA